MATHAQAVSRPRGWLPLVLGVLLILMGAALAIGGMRLATLGGSWYYLIAGVWKSRLPVGAQSTPMTYLSPESGRQLMVVSAGGARMMPDRGDYVIAYGLPKRQ